MKIEELKINPKDKELLKELANPKTIAECAAILGTSYNYTSTKLKVWEAMRLVKKMPKLGKEVKYFLNQDEVEL